MIKKLLITFHILTVIFLLFGLTVSAEEYIFTVNSHFPMPYSDSIDVVNAEHGVYTASSLNDFSYLIEAGIVESYEPMSYSELFDYTPEDYYYTDQTNLSQVFTQFSWNKGVFGKGVKVAIIDSGLYKAAGDFTNANITKAKDYTSTASSTISYCDDEIGHGTMVAGIIAAAHNTRGVAGIAPQCELYIFKCFYLNDYGKEVAKNSDIIAAAYEAIDKYDCDIINLSSGTTSSTIFKQVADYAEKKGVLLVSAVGNSGSQNSNLYYPASYDNVIGVGSVTAEGKRASHSQRNEYVDIMAPGENIYSVRISGYEQGSGTSFATPHVVAAAALAKSLNPNLTREDLIEAIYSTADEIVDRFSGHGILNIQALLTYVKATLSPSRLVYSTDGENTYYAHIPPDGYRNIFAHFESDMLSYAETSLNGKCKNSIFETTKHFIWDINSLSPYTGVVSKLKY